MSLLNGTMNRSTLALFQFLCITVFLINCSSQSNLPYPKLEDRNGNDTHKQSAKDLNTESAFSEDPPDSFRLEAMPSLTNQESTMLAWTESKGANSYELVLSKTENCESANLETKIIPELSYELELGDEGEYFVCISAKNDSGATQAEGSPFSLTVDRKPPSAFAIEPMDAYIAIDRPKLKWTQSTDAIRYSVLLSTNPDCSNAAQYDVESSTELGLNPLEEGTYTLCIDAFDQAGNVTRSRLEQPFTIDLTPPQVFPLDPLPNSLINDEPQFHWSESAHYSQFSVAVSKSADCSDPLTQEDQEARQYQVPTLEDGAYFFCVQAFDAAGNRQHADLSPYEFTIDQTAPAPFSFLSIPQYHNQSNLTIEWMESEGSSEYNVSVHGTRNCLESTVIQSFSTANLQQSLTLDDGTYYICVRASDAAANITLAVEGIQETTIDTLAPGTFSITTLNNSAIVDSVTKTRDRTPSIAWSPSSFSNGYKRVLVSTELDCNSIDGTINSSTTFARIVTVSNDLFDGTYWLCVVAIDRAGNTTVASNGPIMIEIDGTPPDPVSIIQTPPTFSSETSHTIEWMSSGDAEAFDFILEQDGKVVASFEGITEKSVKMVDLADGVYTYTVIAYDNVQNAATLNGEVAPFTIDSTNPTSAADLGSLTHPKPSVASTLTTAEFTWVPGSDSTELTSYCQLDAQPEVECAQSSSHSVSELTDGFHTFRVKFQDQAGNFSAIAEIQFLVDSFCTFEANQNASPFAGGDGTEASPYIICNFDQFKNMNQFLTSSFILRDDIDAEKESGQIDVFEGRLDGQGHSLSRYRGESAVFGTIGGLVANMVFDDVRVGQISNTRFVRYGGIVTDSLRIGGIIENVNIVDSNLYFLLENELHYSIEPRTDVHGFGGIAGLSSGTIRNCAIQLTLFSNVLVGGVVGKNFGIVEGIEADITISTLRYGGGIAAYNHEGAIVRNSQVQIRMDHYDNLKHASGIVGINYGVIDSVMAEGKIDGADYIGGIAGTNSSTGSISNAEAKVQIRQMIITNSRGHHGGLVGQNDGEISTSIFDGFLGFDRIRTGPKDERYRHRDGGFVSVNNGKISNSYSIGTLNVSNGINAGFVAINNGQIINCHSNTTFMGRRPTDAFIANHGLGSDVSASFWNEDITTAPSDEEGGIDSETMQDVDFFVEAGWDFVSIWQMSEENPELRSE